MLNFIIVFLVIISDVFSKFLAVKFLMPLQNDVVVIPSVLSFSYVENRGAAFGILQDHRWIFMTLSVFLIVTIIFAVRYLKIKHLLFTISTSLILGGGIGNMIDRIFLGYVVDFFKVTFIDFPVFNIADCAVVVGTVLLGTYFIFCDIPLNSKKTDGK